jgi:hypothetical protein
MLDQHGCLGFLFFFLQDTFANYNMEGGSQEFVDLRTVRVGVFSEKKLLVVFYLNGVLCRIQYPGKYAPGKSYMCVEARGIEDSRSMGFPGTS